MNAACCAAPEWMSEKAVSTGAYVIASGAYTVLGTLPPVLGSSEVTRIPTKGVGDVIGATFAVEAASLIIDHIDGKRNELGL